MTDRIFGFQGKYRFLSNFFVEADGSTSEHRFQAHKTEDPEYRDWILSAPTPGDAKRRGQLAPLRKDWDSARLYYMEIVVREKFKDPALRALLLATGDAELVEANSWHDTFWGVDQWTERGENHLGKVLMLVRAEASGGA